MGLRCLLGHDFGPSGVVREHEEDGSEMVVTEREVRRCRRCGEEQVLSESTEVRAIRTEEDVGVERRDADAVAPASSTQGAQGSVDSDGNPFGGDGGSNETGAPTDAGDVSTPDEPAATPGAVTADASAADDADSQESNTSLIERAEAGFDAADAGEEDAVILDDGEERDPRGHGEWPDSDAETPAGDELRPDRSTTGEAEATAAPSDRTERTAAVDGGADESTAPETPTDATAPTDAETADEDAEDQSIAETAAEEDAELIGGGPDDASDSGPAANGQAANGRNDAPDEATGSAWPDHDGEDEGFAADDATSGGPGIAYGNEITPESANGQGPSRSHDVGTGGDDYETSYIDNTVEERDGDGTIVSARSDEAAGPRPGVETEYYCPNCGHARPPDSSLRSGDICPECQSGYIAEREQ